MFNFAVVGYGRMGQIHTRNIIENPLCSVSKIYGRNQKGNEFVEEINKEFNLSVEYTSSFDDILNDSDINAVVIASATSAHAEQIIQCLNADKHIFCEKPIALTIEEITECYALAKEKNRIILCGYQRRFDPDIVSIKNKIENGLIGDVQLIRLTSRDHPPPSEEYLSNPSTGSFFDDFSTHDVDMARFLTGEEPSKIYASSSSFLQYQDENCVSDDTAILVLQFPSGAICAIDNSRHTSYGYDVRIEVLGNKGLLSLENPKASNVVLSNRDGIKSDKFKNSFPERFERAYKDELQHFINNLIDSNIGLKVTENDCVQASVITSSAQKSREAQIESNNNINLEEFESTTDWSFDFDLSPYKSLDYEDKIGVAVFGTGRMGRIRSKALQDHPLTEILYGVDVYEPGVKKFAEDFDCEYFVYPNGIEEVFNDPRVKLVFCCTTSKDHHPIISKALAANKHVFCEKPLALSFDDTFDLYNIAKNNNKVLYCAFHRRVDAHFNKMKDLLYNDLGSLDNNKIEFVRVTSREPKSNSDISYLQNSGGFMYDSLIHDIDISRWIIKSKVVQVFSVGHAYIDDIKTVGDIDSITIALRFQNGVLCTIDNHRNAEYGYDQRIEVHTSYKTYKSNNKRASEVKILGSDGVSIDNPPEGVIRYDEAYYEEVYRFINVFLQNSHNINEDNNNNNEIKKIALPPSYGYDAVENSLIAEAAIKSIATGEVINI